MGSVVAWRCAFAAASFAAEIGAAGAQPAADFEPLFDGTLGGATIKNGGQFTVADSVLRAEGPDGWLRLPATARDFRLRVELRFVTDNGDSGIFLRASPDGSFGRG